MFDQSVVNLNACTVDNRVDSSAQPSPAASQETENITAVVAAAGTAPPLVRSGSLFGGCVTMTAADSALSGSLQSIASNECQ